MGGAKNCWIGLVESSDGVNYEWSDGSVFDFGSDISGGVHPWDEGEPSYEWVVTDKYAIEEKCVVIYESKWKDMDCAYKRNFLCQKCKSNKKEEPKSWPSEKPKPKPRPTGKPPSKDKQCDLDVLSVDHKSGVYGKYFNFDKKQLDEILGRY